ncbi:MAG: hypothetical protein JWP91_2956 [Fibrobacteres bacterium]|nr:hypothetical protein [Fibrobacterota bacterium]
MPGKNETQVIGERELTTTRIFDAPREFVFKAWTDPAHVAKWWGPDGFTTTIEKMDLRPGGEWLLVMHGPDGKDYKNKSVFKEVSAPARLVYDHISGPRFLSTVAFDDLDGRTKVTMTMVFESADLLKRTLKEFAADEGAKQTLGRLEAHTHRMSWIGPAAGKNSELYMTRVFDAPRSLVFEAWSKPEHMPRWFAPKGLTMPGFHMDFREGGSVSMTMQMPDGTRSEGEGTYDRIIPQELIAWTSALKFQDPPLIVVSTVRFVELGGKTLLCAHQLYLDSGNPEGALEGWNSSLGNLSEILRESRG